MCHFETVYCVKSIQKEKITHYIIFNISQKKSEQKKRIFYLIVIQGIINKIKKNNKKKYKLAQKLQYIKCKIKLIKK